MQFRRWQPFLSALLRCGGRTAACRFLRADAGHPAGCDLATEGGQLIQQKRALESSVNLRTIDLENEKAELMRTREQMRHFAEHDDLSGLWNHRIIVDRLRGEVDRSRREGVPLSIILADLDYFKRINDTYGHPAGDQVLKEASAIFQRMVRSYDWVGRYGGEEFLLILPGSGFMHARQRAEELRDAIAGSAGSWRATQSSR